MFFCPSEQWNRAYARPDMATAFLARCLSNVIFRCGRSVLAVQHRRRMLCWILRFCHVYLAAVTPPPTGDLAVLPLISISGFATPLSNFRQACWSSVNTEGFGSL